MSSRVAPLKKVNDLKTLTSAAIPIRDVPSSNPGSVVINQAGNQLIVRKPDGSTGTVPIA